MDCNIEDCNSDCNIEDCYRKNLRRRRRFASGRVPSLQPEEPEEPPGTAKSCMAGESCIKNMRFSKWEPIPLGVVIACFVTALLLALSHNTINYVKGALVTRG
ncbi:hypothetical protein CEXT_230021 [Caerostris extrusa]|uniref:Uncharacterized protein n=1 Tax=Caerostris extrusa TaxID=172846 RepID=A0AAV4UIN5_CAEEX|nr:hypothetical protein CEXT_230021 [Caerostris extrusa]